MENLLSLVIFRPTSFTGLELVTQPSLSQLDLVYCRQLRTEGLRHPVHVFPNLTSSGMVTEVDFSMTWPRARASIDSFVDISQLHKLKLVDLSGLANITAGQAGALERAIKAQQELGLLQPAVRLYLPIGKERERDGSRDYKVYSR